MTNRAAETPLFTQPFRPRVVPVRRVENLRATILDDHDLDESQPCAVDEDRTNRLFDAFVSSHLGSDWSYEWSTRSRTRAGSCDYRRQVLRIGVAVARHATLGEVVDTLLHEIAHALTGPGIGHGPQWQEICRAIGGDGERCHDLATPAPKWKATCEKGHTVTRHTRRKTWCGVCAGDAARRGRRNEYLRTTEPLAWVPNDDVEPVVQPGQEVDRSAFRVGDEVVVNAPGSGYDQMRGRAKRVNAKSVTLDVGGGRTLRVPYRFVAAPEGDR